MTNTIIKNSINQIKSVQEEILAIFRAARIESDMPMGVYIFTPKQSVQYKELTIRLNQLMKGQKNGLD